MGLELGQERARALRALEDLLARIEEARPDLEGAQARLEGLLPMRVVWKEKTCGKEGCRCARGALHGPYAYLITHRGGKRYKEYLGSKWTPPEGLVAPERYRRLMGEFNARRKWLEGLLQRLDRAVEMMRGWK